MLPLRLNPLLFSNNVLHSLAAIFSDYAAGDMAAMCGATNAGKTVRPAMPLAAVIAGGPRGRWAITGTDVKSFTRYYSPQFTDRSDHRPPLVGSDLYRSVD